MQTGENQVKHQPGLILSHNLGDCRQGAAKEHPDHKPCRITIFWNFGTALDSQDRPGTSCSVTLEGVLRMSTLVRDTLVSLLYKSSLHSSFERDGSQNAHARRTHVLPKARFKKGCLGDLLSNAAVCV